MRNSKGPPLQRGPACGQADGVVLRGASRASNT